MNEWRDVAVSVIVPAHNVEPYIGQTLASILAQTLVSLEVLVVDDASTDGTARVVAEHAARDRRVRLIRQWTNGGVSRARNRALQEARGYCSAFVDADDWLHPRRLATMIGWIRQLELDWLADDQFIVSGPGQASTGRVLRWECRGASRISPAHLVRRDPPERIGYGTLKAMVRNDFLRRTGLSFRVGAERHEDFLFHLDCGLLGARMGLLNEQLYFYRRRDDSMTAGDPVETLVGMLEHNAVAAEAALQAGQAAVSDALTTRATQIRRSLAYRRLLADLRRRDLRGAMRRLRGGPTVGFTLAGRLGLAAARRMGVPV